MTKFLKSEPYLYYGEQAGEALDWLQRTFGLGDVESVTEDGKVTEGQVSLGDFAIHATGAAMEPGTGTGALVIVTVDDVTSLYEHIRASGVELDPPKHEPYGPVQIHVTDPWGYRWYFWQGTAVYS